MSRICEITGKKPVRGYQYAIRGIAKKKKGIGLKTTGKTKRSFYPNVVKKRFWNPETNAFVTMRVSASAMRTITKKGIVAVLKNS